MQSDGHIFLIIFSAATRASSLPPAQPLRPCVWCPWSTARAGWHPQMMPWMRRMRPWRCRWKSRTGFPPKRWGTNTFWVYFCYSIPEYSWYFDADNHLCLCGCSFQNGDVDLWSAGFELERSGSEQFGDCGSVVQWQDRAMEAYVLCKMSVVWRQSLGATWFLAVPSQTSIQRGTSHVQEMFKPTKLKHRGLCRKVSTTASGAYTDPSRYMRKNLAV